VFTLRQDLINYVTCVKLYALQYYFVLRLLAELKPASSNQNCDRWFPISAISTEVSETAKK
jgi:hypothetical protein